MGGSAGEPPRWLSVPPVRERPPWDCNSPWPAAAANKPTLYVNFQENPTQLGNILNTLDPARGGNGRPYLHFLYTSAVELQIDRTIVEMFELIQAHGIRRVVIDAVGDLSMAASDQQRVHDYLYALVQRFTVRGITAVLMLEDTAQGPLGKLGSGDGLRTPELPLRQPDPSRGEPGKAAPALRQHL